jgi:hypothetical protein
MMGGWTFASRVRPTLGVALGGEDERTRKRMESNVDTPNTDQTGLNRVARLQAVHDEVEERSMGWVEGVGEGIGVSNEAQRLCQR